MTAVFKDVLPIASELEFADRARLAEHLLMSLDEPSEAEVERLWLNEAKRRFAAYCAGQTEAVPAEEVFRRAIADLS